MWVMSWTQWRLELTEEENRSGEAVPKSPGEARGAKAPYSPKKTRSIMHRAQERPPRVMHRRLRWSWVCGSGLGR